MTEHGAAAGHLILGASHGLGYAYAEYYATRGARLTLVARSETDLERAREQLAAAGAASVQTRPGDLTDPSFRRVLLETHSADEFDSVLVGGPSPPAGYRRDVTPDMIAAAAEICLAYPLDVFSWVERTSSASRPKIVAISSSAAEQPLCDHEFFLSALLRRSLDDLIECFRQRTGLPIETWKPPVVLTRLSETYAAELAGTVATPERILSSHFGLPCIESARGYSWKRLR